MEPIPLERAMPSIVDELRDLLEKEGHHTLAMQVSGLHVHGRCRCKQDDCATFYAASGSESDWQSGRRCIVLNPDKGMMVIDVVGEAIVGVEILDRPELAAELESALTAPLSAQQSRHDRGPLRAREGERLG